MRNRTLMTVFGLSLFLGLSACGEDRPGGGDTGVENDGGMNDGSMNDGGDDFFGTATGQLQQSQNEGENGSMNGGSVEGFAVTAHRVSGQGRTSITGESGETDAEGNFSVSVDVQSAIKDFVVSAQKESAGSGEVIVSKTLEQDGSVTVEPISVESSVESDVYVEARSSGSWSDGGCEGCTTAQLRTMIESNTAALVDASADYQSDVQAEAKAVVAGMKAWERGLQENAGAAQADIDAALETQTTARGTLSTALADAESSSEVEAAIETYIDAVATAYSDNNIDAKMRGVAAQSTAEAMTALQAAMTAQAKQRARVNAELWRAQRVHAAVEAHADAMAEWSQSRQDAVAQAYTDLQADLEAAASASSDFETQLEDAWANYCSDVRAEIYAALEAEADSGIDFAGSVKSEIDAALSTARSTYTSALDITAGASADAAAQTSVQAFGSLWSSVNAQGNLDIVTGASATATGISEGSAESSLKAMAHLTALAEVSGSGQ